MNLFKKISVSQKVLILILLVMAFVFTNGCSERAQGNKTYRVGILSGLHWFDQTIDGFKTGMTNLGYIEGRDIVYDIHKAHIDPILQEQGIKKFVAEKVDLILVYPTEASLLTKQMTQGTNIPVVFTNAILEGTNLVLNVRQPGGNITGVRYPGPEILVKRLEFLQRIAPEAKRVLVLYDPNYPNNIPTLKLIRPAAIRMNITLVEVNVTSAKAIKAELQKRSTLQDIGVDAILMMSEIVSTGPESWAAITEFGYQHKVPILGGIMVPGEKGCLLGYSPDAFKVGEMAAPLANKIFKSVQAGTIPVVSPDSYLQFNYKQAQFFGLKVPEGVLAQAVEIAR